MQIVFNYFILLIAFDVKLFKKDLIKKTKILFTKYLKCLNLFLLLFFAFIRQIIKVFSLLGEKSLNIINHYMRDRNNNKNIFLGD